MTDFNTLVNSDDIEDKLKAVQDSACPSEVIIEILNHETIDFYVNTKNGLDYCGDFCDMRDEMTKEGLDPENEDDIRKYLKKYTNG